MANQSIHSRVELLEQIVNDLRGRDTASKLRKTDWLVARHRDQKELGIETSITEEQYIDLLRYRQECRNNYTKNEGE